MADEPKVKKPPDFVGGSLDTEGEIIPKEQTALMDNIAYLENSLDNEKDERLEERFRWICCTSLLIDVLAIAAMNGSWLFIPLFMLQLIILIGFAKAYGVDWAEQLIGKLLYWVSEWGKDKKD